MDAWKQAQEAISEQTAPAARFQEAAARYARTVDLVDDLYCDWVDAGKPKTAKGGATGRADVAHPSLKAIAEAERDAAKFGAMLGLDLQSRKALGAVRGRPQERVPPKANEPPKVVPLRAA